MARDLQSSTTPGPAAVCDTCLWCIQPSIGRELSLIIRKHPKFMSLFWLSVGLEDVITYTLDEFVTKSPIIVFGNSYSPLLPIGKFSSLPCAGLRSCQTKRWLGLHIIFLLCRVRLTILLSARAIQGHELPAHRAGFSP